MATTGVALATILEPRKADIVREGVRACVFAMEGRANRDNAFRTTSGREAPRARVRDVAERAHANRRGRTRAVSNESILIGAFWFFIEFWFYILKGFTFHLAIKH